MSSFLSSLKPNPKTIVSDTVAGFSTGLFSIPEGMAYASLAGVNPVYGLYSGMVATIVAAMTTGTILMISTLTSAIALATASVISEAGLTGNAGCNDYFGPYETDGDNISMGPFGTIRKACQESEGIMEQEAQYLAALETATTYKIEGGLMEMRTDEGAIAVQFRRVLP